MKTGIAVSMLALLALAGCAQRASNPQSHASAAQIAACRHSADQAILIQNPGTVYQSDAYVAGTRATPFSGQGYSSSDITGGLPQRYSREQYYDNCLNGIGPAPVSFPSEEPSGPGISPAPTPRVTSSPLSPRQAPAAIETPPANLSAPPASLTAPPP
jgi:hypothetical protein